MIASHVTHYFEKERGPLLSVCDLSPKELAALVEQERAAETGFNRFAAGPDFFDFRRLADDLLLDLHARTFGTRAPRRPFYAALGDADVIAGLYRDPYKIAFPVAQFAEHELTFMVPDHFHLVSLNKINVARSYGFQLPEDYTEESYPYFGKLLTYSELQASFAELRIDRYLARRRELNCWYRYIEAQIWADPASLDLDTARWVEADPEPWTSRSVSYLQNYKRIAAEQTRSAARAGLAVRQSSTPSDIAMRFPKSYTLETRRCRLRHVSEADIPHIFEATRYAGFNDGMRWEPPETEAELIAPYERNVAAWETGSAYCFTIETKAEAAFVGRIVIRSEDSPDAWNLGFWTHPAQQSKGFMTEAAQSMIDFGFGELNARRIVACHAIWNRASEQVLRKCGLALIRHEPQGFQKRGAWVAENVLEIAREGWKATRQPTPTRDPRSTL